MMKNLIFVVLCSWLVGCTFAAPAAAPSSVDAPVPYPGILSRNKRDASQGAFAKAYLDHYNYLPVHSEAGALADESDANAQMTLALKEFQQMANIEQTGVLDEETLKMMSMPRCGNPDKKGPQRISKRRKRYVLHSSKWQTNVIPYFIQNVTPDMRDGDVERDIAKAFQIWSEVTPLTFTKVGYFNRNNINIKFASGYHHDAYPFDGKGSIIAHAFYPQFYGDVHFDEDELWTARSYSGKNLLQAAVHELGHSLGLEHSKNRDAVMAPFYRKYNPNLQLHSDDINGINQIYGPTPTPPNPGPGTSPGVSSISDPCLLQGVDAMTRFPDGFTYAFKGAFYYKLSKSKVVGQGYIEDLLPGVPGNLSAALYWPQTASQQPATNFFFKGDFVWRQQNSNMEKMSLADMFPGLPGDLHAAYVWSGNRRTYFVKGGWYYRVSRTTNSNGGYTVDSGYPQRLTVWGLKQVDAALQYNNNITYFFNGNQYYRFNDNTFGIPAADPPYPRPIAYWWLSCQKAGSLVDPKSEHKDVDGSQKLENGFGLELGALLGSQTRVCGSAGLIFSAFLVLYIHFVIFTV